MIAANRNPTWVRLIAGGAVLLALALIGLTDGISAVMAKPKDELLI